MPNILPTQPALLSQLYLRNVPTILPTQPALLSQLYLRNIPTILPTQPALLSQICLRNVPTILPTQPALLSHFPNTFQPLLLCPSLFVQLLSHLSSTPQPQLPCPSPIIQLPGPLPSVHPLQLLSPSLQAELPNGPHPLPAPPPLVFQPCVLHSSPHISQHHHLVPLTQPQLPNQSPCNTQQTQPLHLRPPQSISPYLSAEPFSGGRSLPSYHPPNSQPCPLHPNQARAKLLSIPARARRLRRSAEGGRRSQQEVWRERGGSCRG